MKGPLYLSLAALLVSGLALATLFVQGSDGARPGAEPARPAATATAPELLARLDTLVEENRRLRDRVAMLENLPAPAPREILGGSWVSVEQFEAFREEVRAALDRSAPLAALEPARAEEFKAQVADTLSDIRREEFVEKARAGIEKRRAAIDANLPKVESWLGLSPAQTESMRAVMQTQLEREAEYLRLWEIGADRELIGEQKLADREALRTELSGFLNEEQVERWMSGGGGRGK